jgi:hypothetical protein
MTQWPGYLIERVREIPPVNCGVIHGSTPVVSFGHPLRAKVATLGINPSTREFLAADGSLLTGGRRRLATLASLGVENYESIDTALAAEIVEDCATYFDREPYGWFDALDRILCDSLAVSYFKATACHLDLVQWATDQVWGRLNDQVRGSLLADDRSFLIRQLQNEQYRVILVNGRTAMDWVQRAGLVKWREIRRLAGPPPTVVYLSSGQSATFIGWSCNLQSQPGAKRHSRALTELVSEYASAALGATIETSTLQ